MAEDVFPRQVDAASKRIRRLGVPAAAGDATFTDNATAPKPDAAAGAPGKSLLAAPADHVHPAAAPLRVVAHGSTTVAAGARVTLATFKRGPGELFATCGFAFVKDNVAGVTWESEVDGATHLGTYHERTQTPDELSFRAVNASSAARTLEWATVALAIT